MSLAMPIRERVLETHQFVLRALDRHRSKGVMVFGMIAALVMLGTLYMPRTYFSEARLLVRFGRENQAGPTASNGQMIAFNESREREINSLIEIFKSRAIHDRVVSALGPELVLFDGPPGDRTSQVAASPALHQLAVVRLSKDVSIGAPRRSNIITVACKSRSPAVAQQIVAKLVEVYQEDHVRVHRSPGNNPLFDEQIEQSLAAWQKAADELGEKKDRLGIVAIDGRKKKLEDQISDIDSKRLANHSDLETSRAKIASLEKLTAGLPTTTVTQPAGGPNVAADDMRQTLETLEAVQQNLAAKMQDDHPRLMAVRQQVSELREMLTRQPGEKVKATEALNPSRQTLEASLLAERALADSLAARER